ncbi:hypothetical protein EMCRGX_G023624 [Ephydatia muelleri]
MASLSNGFLEAGLLYPREWCREDTAATYTCMVLGFRGLAEVGYKQCNSFFRAKDWDQLEGVTETLVAPDTGGVDGDYGCKVADSSFCVKLVGWRCIPLAVESYGAWGPEALRAFSQVATRLAVRGNTPTSKVVAELYGRLSLLLVRANARSILVRSYPQKTQQENELFT